MANDTLKLPFTKLEVPKLKRWDLIALVTLIASLGLAGLNLRLAFDKPPGVSLGNGVTLLFALGQLFLSSAGLMVLGKTAKAGTEGTIWGILASVAAMLAGISGVLLAAALWSAA